MALSNTHISTLIDRLFEGYSRSGEINFPFVIVENPSSGEAYAFLRELLRSKVGGFWNQDFREMKDLSVSLGKKHEIRVSVQKKDQIVVLDDGSSFENIGTRQLIEWLSLSPAGGVKVVLIEDINRMNSSSYNSLLKRFEEPTIPVLIVATTKNIAQLIPTLRSRAFLLRRQEKTVEHLLQEYSSVEDRSLLYASISLSGGNDRLMKKYLENSVDNETISLFQQLEKNIFVEKKGRKTPKIVKELRGSITDSHLIDSLIVSSELNGQRHCIPSLIHAKRMISANVQSESVRFSLGMS